jgi:outer membrane protein TolC
MKANLLTIMVLAAMWAIPSHAQRTLDYFVAQAMKNSPLIVSSRNQKMIDAEEMQRLKSIYVHSHMELTGDLLFVPIISTDDGRTSFKMDAQNATKYYGYDLGQSSSHINVGLNWTKPLTGGKGLKEEQELLRVNQAISDNNIHLTEHDLKRQITEQYLLCQLDIENEHSFMTIDSILIKQIDIVGKLSSNGLTSPTDVQLLKIERQTNQNLRQAAKQSYITHRAELNTICGINDSSVIVQVNIEEQLPDYNNSKFFEQYKLDSIQAQSTYNTYRNQYRPQLFLYASGGAQTGTYMDLYKRWGVSAGLHFSLTLYDGKQLKNRRRQMKIQQNTAESEQHYAEKVRSTRISELLQLIKSQDLQINNGSKQLDDYRKLLSDYQKEIMAGRRSIVDYVNVFGNYRRQISHLNELKINRNILMNTYNYWNW